MDTQSSKAAAEAAEARKMKVERGSRSNSDAKNPCLKEQEMSYRCLADNNYDRQKCEVIFANYKTCKEFWYHVSLDRRRRGIYPYLPDLDEREQVKQEYKSKF